MKILTTILRFFLFPLIPIFWIIEQAITPLECRIELSGWIRLWLTGDCKIPCSFE